MSFTTERFQGAKSWGAYPSESDTAAHDWPSVLPRERRSPFFQSRFGLSKMDCASIRPLKCDIASSGVIWAAAVRRNVT